MDPQTLSGTNDRENFVLLNNPDLAILFESYDWQFE